jgi:hypothetical protein
MQEERPPWDVRLIGWMQESARHKGSVPRPPLTRRGFVAIVGAMAALGAFWAVTGINVWPGIAGLGAGLAVRLWEIRPHSS